MKIVHRLYILLSIIIVTASINLFLLLSTTQGYQMESNFTVGAYELQIKSIVQGLLGADIVILFIVLFSSTRSLKPLKSLSVALARIKEGKYGEEIKYESNDEIGAIMGAFNSMSKTLKEKTEKEKLEIIKASSTSLFALISDLLDAQKLDLSQLKFRKLPNYKKSSVAKSV